MKVTQNTEYGCESLDYNAAVNVGFVGILHKLLAFTVYSPTDRATVNRAIADDNVIVLC